MDFSLSQILALVGNLDDSPNGAIPLSRFCFLLGIALPRHAELTVNMAGSMASVLLTTFVARRQ